METPDVPVDENTEQKSPVVSFVLTALYLFLAFPFPREINKVDSSKILSIYLSIAFFVIGIFQWKGREIAQLVLNRFPPKNRKSIYYFLSVLHHGLSLLILSGLFIFQIHTIVMRKTEGSYASPIDLADALLSICICWGLCIDICEFVKNYRLYQAARPQPQLPQL